MLKHVTFTSSQKYSSVLTGPLAFLAKCLSPNPLPLQDTSPYLSHRAILQVSSPMEAKCLGLQAKYSGQPYIITQFEWFQAPSSLWKKKKKKLFSGLPSLPSGKELPCNTGDLGSSPSQGMKIPHASEQLSQCTESPPNGIVDAISFYPEPRAPFISKVQAFYMLSSGTLHPLICSRNSSRSPFLSGPELLPLWTLAGKMVEEPSLNSFSF